MTSIGTAGRLHCDASNPGQTERVSELASVKTQSRASSRLKTWLRATREWEINPVLLKELRQAMRSNLLIGTFSLLLTLLGVAAVIFLARQELLSGESPAQELGIPLLELFVIILTVAAAFIIPLYIGIRLAAERRQHDLDLMFATTLGPGQIVRGKWYCGLYLAGMVFSLCMPFMTFTILLRGVDIPTLIAVLFCVFGGCCLAVQGAILVACLPWRAFLKMLAGLFFVAGLAGLCGGLLVFSFFILSSGVGTVLSTPRYCLNCVMLVLWTLCGIGLLQVISVSLIVPNRPFQGNATAEPK